VTGPVLAVHSLFMGDSFWAEEFGVGTPVGARNFPFCTLVQIGLDSTQPLTQWLLVLFPGGKAA